MSVLTYNGITLQVTSTKQFAIEPVYSADGSELLWNRLSLQVQGVYNPLATSHNPTSGSAEPGWSPAATHEAIYRALMQPRCALFYGTSPTLGVPETIVESPASGYSTDADGRGPRPLGVDIRFMGESKTWLVTWRVESMLPACPGQPDSPIVSSRFTRAHAVDEDRFTTITTQGVTVFRSDALHALERAADFYRSQIVPKCPLGFRRVGPHIQINEEGNVLAWQVVDREMSYYLGHANDPRNLGVIRFEGVYTQSSSSPDGRSPGQGVDTMASVSIRAYGANESRTPNLMTWAMMLATEKLGLTAADPVVEQGDPMIVSVRASVHMHAKMVDLHIDARIAPTKNGKGFFGGLPTDPLFEDVIKMFPNDGQVPNPAGAQGTRGSYRGMLFANILRTQCTDVSLTPKPPGIDPNNNGNSTLFEPPAVIDVKPTQDILASRTTRYSPDHASGAAFSDYKVDARYEVESGVMQVPASGPAYNRPSAPAKVGASPDSDSDPDAPPEAVFLTLHPPITRKIVHWVAERRGAKPLIPSIRSTDPNEVVVEAPQVSASSATLAPDGITKIWRREGTYYYGLKKYKEPGRDVLHVGVLPWTDFLAGSEEACLMPSEFRHGIADPASSGGGGIGVAPGGSGSPGIDI